MVTFDDSAVSFDNPEQGQRPAPPPPAQQRRQGGTRGGDHIADVVGDLVHRSENFSKYRSGRSYVVKEAASSESEAVSAGK